MVTWLAGNPPPNDFRAEKDICTSGQGQIRCSCCWCILAVLVSAVLMSSTGRGHQTELQHSVNSKEQGLSRETDSRSAHRAIARLL